MTKNILGLKELKDIYNIKQTLNKYFVFHHIKSEKN